MTFWLCNFKWLCSSFFTLDLTSNQVASKCRIEFELNQNAESLITTNPFWVGFIINVVDISTKNKGWYKK